MKRLLLTAVLFCLCYTTAASAQGHEARCVHVTWFTGAADKTGTTVKGFLYPTENRLIYDFKNGAMDFIWLLPEGMKSGDPDGLEGSWQQDDGKGTFLLKENRKTGIFEGHRRKKGSKKSEKLKVEYCKTQG